MGRIRSTARLGCVSVVLAPALLAAQAAGPAREWQVAPFVSVTNFDGSSAIETAPGIGVQALYFLTGNLAVGPTFGFARTRSDGSFFPALQWNLDSDSSRLVLVGQELSLAAFGARAEAHFAVPRGRAFGAAGAGVYNLYLDPQSNGGAAWVRKPALELAGGVDVAVGERTGIRLELRDFIMTGYDRERLRLVDERFESRYFVQPDVPPAKSTIHNLTLAAGFTYVP